MKRKLLSGFVALLAMFISMTGCGQSSKPSLAVSALQLGTVYAAAGINITVSAVNRNIPAGSVPEEQSVHGPDDHLILLSTEIQNTTSSRLDIGLRLKSLQEDGTLSTGTDIAPVNINGQSYLYWQTAIDVQPHQSVPRQYYFSIYPTIQTMTAYLVLSHTGSTAVWSSPDLFSVNVQMSQS